jgi:hypothetical protein
MGRTYSSNVEEEGWIDDTGGKDKGKRQLGRPKPKLDLVETECGDMNGVDLTQDTETVNALVITVAIVRTDVSENILPPFSGFLRVIALHICVTVESMLIASP